MGRCLGGTQGDHDQLSLSSKLINSNVVMPANGKSARTLNTGRAEFNHHPNRILRKPVLVKYHREEMPIADEEILSASPSRSKASRTGNCRSSCTRTPPLAPTVTSKLGRGNSYVYVLCSITVWAMARRNPTNTGSGNHIRTTVDSSRELYLPGPQESFMRQLWLYTPPTGARECAHDWRPLMRPLMLYPNAH